MREGKHPGCQITCRSRAALTMSFGYPSIFVEFYERNRAWAEQTYEGKGGQAARLVAAIRGNHFAAVTPYSPRD